MQSPAQCPKCISSSCSTLFKSVAISNCSQGVKHCRGGAQLHSLLAQLVMGSQLALGGRQPDLNPIWCLMLGWHPVTTSFTTGWLEEVHVHCEDIYNVKSCSVVSVSTYRCMRFMKAVGADRRHAPRGHKASVSLSQNTFTWAKSLACFCFHNHTYSYKHKVTSHLNQKAAVCTISVKGLETHI